LGSVKNIVIELHEKMRKGSTLSYEKAIQKFSFKSKKLSSTYAICFRFLVNNKL